MIFMASQASRSYLEAQGSLGRPRAGPGRAQKPLRNGRLKFQENQFFCFWDASGGLRGTENRWGASLARRKKVRFPAILDGERVVRLLGPPLAQRAGNQRGSFGDWWFAVICGGLR